MVDDEAPVDAAGVARHNDFVRSERAAVLRWRRGQEAAAKRSRELAAEEGPRPERAVAEALSALEALAAAGLWPGPRDPVSERAVDIVRRRWALMEKRARHAKRAAR